MSDDNLLIRIGESTLFAPLILAERSSSRYVRVLLTLSMFFWIFATAVIWAPAILVGVLVEIFADAWYGQ